MCPVWINKEQYELSDCDQRSTNNQQVCLEPWTLNALINDQPTFLTKILKYNPAWDRR